MNKFFDNGNFNYRSEISRPPFPIDSFRLAITSQFAGAKDPTERHACLDVTLEREGLEKLRDVIDLHLAQFGEMEIEGAPV